MKSSILKLSVAKHSEIIKVKVNRSNESKRKVYFFGRCN